MLRQLIRFRLTYYEVTLAAARRPAKQATIKHSGARIITRIVPAALPGEYCCPMFQVQYMRDTRHNLFEMMGDVHKPGVTTLANKLDEVKNPLSVPLVEPLARLIQDE